MTISEKIGKKKAKTISEKIEEKKAKIAAAQERIGKEQDKISKYRRELDTLESLEVKAMLKEIDMPLDQVVVKRFLSTKRAFLVKAERVAAAL